MNIKTIDRHLLKEMLKFIFLALLSVVTIYLLVDLFEELSYFTTRKTPLLVVLRYYFYSLPSAIILLYPVSLVLAAFVVYGQMTRNNEISALKSAGIIIYRIFIPAVVIGVATVFLYIGWQEFIAIPCNRRLSDLRRYVIEKRTTPAEQRRQNLYRVDGNRVLWTQELVVSALGETPTLMRNFLVVELDRNRRVRYRIDGETAIYEKNGWKGINVTYRQFDSSGKEIFNQRRQTDLNNLENWSEDWLMASRPIEETPTITLKNYIVQMKKAGENVAREEVEYHYRFSYALIGLIVLLLGLPLSVQLRRGGVMFGLGLGLLFSFLYWGTIQTCRAFGASHLISPALSAWLPNIIFGLVAGVLLIKVAR